MTKWGLCWGRWTWHLCGAGWDCLDFHSRAFELVPLYLGRIQSFAVDMEGGR